ncbi:MAG TPA: PQQ-binding-like beta-propeller repeat protein, partial [Phycisphaerae bacterium]|nr:PQQ-binding-like beta-propeller repeat protein [Phycisphaerae bacterium]
MIRNRTDNSPAAQGPPLRYRVALWTACAAGAFSLAVCGMLAHNFYGLRTGDPLNDPALLALKASVLKDPADAGLKERFRRMDLEHRAEFFYRQRLTETGGYLLAGGLAVFLVAIRCWLAGRRRLPSPGPPPDEEARDAAARRGARWAVTAITAGVCISAGAWASASFRAPPPTPAGLTVRTDATPVTTAPSAEEVRRNWPRFRGPGGSGVSAFTNVPTRWNGDTVQNILWKTAIPLPGKNSPVVWGDRVFLTGATKVKREVYCFNAASGALLWRRAVETAVGRTLDPPEIEEDTSYAAPTAATDGQRVYAIFANGDLVCLDFAGRQVWSEGLAPLDNQYGHASSLAMHRNLLLVQLDQEAPDEGGPAPSVLLAYDGPRGKRVWEAYRAVEGSWMSPIVIATPAGPQVIAGGNPFLIAHDPTDGKEIWRARVLGADCAPSPIFAGGLVIVAQPYGELSAVRPDGRGDVTETHVAWRAAGGMPEICSPASDGKLVWTLMTYGLLTCYDAKDGKIVWEKQIDAEFNASPSLVGDRLYLLSTKGVAIIIETGRAYRELSRAELGEPVHASPAFADGRIYIRGKEHLYCIGEAK